MSRANGSIDAVVFDLGGVLIDWNPRYLFRELLPEDPERMEWFLANVCNDAWNLEQDAGRPFAEAVALLCASHPEHEALIRAYDARWEDMLKGPIPESVAILDQLRRNGQPLYALTNWSSEKFPVALQRFDFLQWFDHIVVSGDLRMRKPHPEIFHHLLERSGTTAARTFFVDDNRHNVDAARALGFDAVLFTTPDALRSDLVSRGLL